MKFDIIYYFIDIHKADALVKKINPVVIIYFGGIDFIPSFIFFFTLS